MKLTTGSGMWPALWMMPTPINGNYHDGDGEIDIMEQVGTDPTRDEAHLHHNGVQGNSYDTGIDLSSGFHTYGIDWEADHMTWYFDGKPFFTVTQNIPTVAEYLILNLAIGDANSWPGAPDANTVLPQSMQIDYVHVFQKAGETAVGPGAITNPVNIVVASSSSSASNAAVAQPSLASTLPSFDTTTSADSSVSLQTDASVKFSSNAGGSQASSLLSQASSKNGDDDTEVSTFKLPTNDTSTSSFALAA
jgi:beta-glucanase (GH16 family)